MKHLNAHANLMGNRLGRDNALNLIRLCLAVLVIVSHAFPIAGFGPDPALGGLGLGSFAVGGFFAISGYLITQSRFRSDLKGYTIRRALRILPGYWACLVFTSVVAAGLAGVVRGGWSAVEAGKFIGFDAVMVKAGGSDIGTTLTGLPYPGAWNGSLWTLRFEVLCYIVVGAALTVGFVRRQQLVFPAAFAVATAASLAVHMSGVGGVPADLALLVPFFAAGATLRAYAHKLPVSASLALASLVALAAVLAAGQGKSLSALPVAYLMLWLGIVIPKRFADLCKRDDFSYGTYLYAFPMQQWLVIGGAARFGPAAFIGLSILATAPFAVLSWFLVEQPSNGLFRSRRQVPTHLG
ncbi:acyltransferase [Pseudarthrobacter sp. efr-133-R2A-89]|uniref:acyltransferase family protein n=1 Tax=Pseudarthrobacter sp. efr-133-R2A-89 TaxID=3040302 RepID=UPI00255718A5|nr:acyltransferase [Pseudarthrobacter sp. efr-133-R2A-89]